MIGLGINCIIAPNQGDRQLGGAFASIDALLYMIDKVSGQIPVLIIAVIRSGSDVVKALALGATACLVGWPQLWGLASAR